MHRKTLGVLAFKMKKTGQMFAVIDGRLESLQDVLAALTGRPVEYDEAVMFLRMRKSVNPKLSPASPGQKGQKMLS